MGRFAWSLVNNLSAEYRRFRRSITEYVGLSPEEAAAESRRHLHRYLIYCRTYSPYWRERWPKEAEDFTPAEADEVLALLPVLRKDDLRAHLGQLRIAPETRRPGDGYPAIRAQQTFASGGSTGVPVLIYIDANYLDRSRATYDFFYRLCGLQPGNPFFYIWGSPNELTDIKTSWKKRLAIRLRGVRPMPAFGLSPEKIIRIRDEIDQQRNVQSAMFFTSTADTVMNFAEREGLKFRRLKRVFTGGGLLHERLRELIQRHLAPDVFDTYASRDFAMMAHETPAHDGLSVAAWFNRVEVLDAAGQHVEPGEKGEVHITAINNYNCALIRVAMGDTARWYPGAGRNPLPTPRLTELMGRTVEHLEGPNGIVIDPSAVIHITGVVIAPEWLRKFQLVQRSPVRYVLRTEAWDGNVSAEQVRDLQARLGNELSNLVRQRVELEVVVLDEIPPLRSGKHQYCLKEPDETERN
ncbi:MAG: hypothetical protein WCF57_15335 [Pyrinomonadaceae bacterium]